MHGDRHQFISLKITVLLLLFVFDFRVVECGRPKTKPGVLAASQVKTGIKKKNAGYEIVYDGGKEVNNGSSHGKHMSTVKKLKHSLLHKYDSTLIPLAEKGENLRVKVGFAFRQVLDLDEKNQILKSLIWFRMFWNDHQLTWDPDEYNGIKEIEVPHNDIWMPNIVVYEEIGVRDYSPRLRSVKIHYDGEVEYREPTVYETSCSIDTAFFPFDVQVCYITFVSWTEAVTKIDLISDSLPLKVLDDAKRYFINTGEWQLVGIDVDKIVKDFDELFDSEATRHHSKEFVDLIESLEEISILNQQDESSGEAASEAEHIMYRISHEHKKMLRKSEYPMKPQQPTNYTTLGNVTMKSSMFSEVRYTIVVRRNSSLYMQSMLFPSILLTTVALLGFYLPPDSGERIGLQITILLTFMVFLLAVGEMFPASTGPYLGVYFVLCMGLLGVNLAMTVLVLHLHFKPVVQQDADVQRKRMKILMQTRHRCYCRKSNLQKLNNNLYKSKKSVIPKPLRQFLQFCDRYWSLKEYNARWLYQKDLPDEETDLQNSSSSTNDEDDSSCCEEKDEKSSLHQLYDRPGATLSPKYVKDRKLKKNNSKYRENKVYSEKDEKELKRRNLNKRSSELRCQEINNSDLISREKHPKSEAESETSPSYAESFQSRNFTRLPLDEDCSSSSKVRSNGWEATHHHQKSPQMNGGVKESPGNENLLQTDSFVNIPLNRQDTSPFRQRILGVLNELKNHVKKSEKEKIRKKTLRQKREKKKRREKEKEQEREEMEQEEWKSVARAIDVLCFRFYVSLIVISHLALLGAALNTYLSDHNLSFIEPRA